MTDNYKPWVGGENPYMVNPLNPNRKQEPPLCRMDDASCCNCGEFYDSTVHAVCPVCRSPKRGCE